MTWPPQGTHTPEWLAQRARLSPRTPALLWGDAVWSFAGLERRVAALAGRLARAGVAPGDRVALMARNGPAFVLAAWAVPRLGGVLVPLNLRLTASELAWQVRDCGASLLAHDRANAQRARELAEAVPGLRLLEVGTTGDDSEAVAPPETIDLSSVHSIIYTSGTTGRPKGAMLTFGNHLWNAIGSVLNLGLREDDRWLACLPLFHVGGLAILIRSVVYGIPVVLQDGFDAAAVNEAIDGRGVTIVSVVSTMLQRMLEERGELPYPPTLRCVLVGGGPVPRPLLEECARRGIPTVQTYGLTEAASQVTTLAPADALRKLGSAGRPLFPVTVRIADEAGRPLPPGEAGEILVRGPTVTAGYFGRPEETARALRDGWLHTGDIGYLDQEGYLYVLDRRDDLIVSGGENVYPAEVEAVLRQHPAVADAAVIGLPDERWGQTVAAAVVLRPGCAVDGDELVRFCRERLAGYKVPRCFRIVPSLPRNAAGKLLRRALREEWPAKSA